MHLTAKDQRILTGAGCLLAIAVDIALHRHYAEIFAIPIVWSAACDGWRGGSIAAAALSAFLFFLPGYDGLPDRVVHALFLFAIGVIAGFLFDRERRSRKYDQQRIEEMSAVQDKLHTAFEGMKRTERLSALGQLSAGLAHEIRNPLASIAGATAILQRNHQLEPREAKCLDIIAMECRRLDELLTNFLNFARPRPPHFRVVDLNSILDIVVTLAAHRIRDKQVFLEKNTQQKLPAVECDPEQLEQVLLNLMINAIEASPPGETVTLRVEPMEKEVAIRVVDRGHGVAPIHVDRLFDPFFTTKEEGTGLGLPVAHQIVAQMGGTLLAESNPEKGMTFSVILTAVHST